MIHFARNAYHRLRSLKLKKDYPDYHLSREDLKERIFCFGGEFGYELVSWIPYLRFVAEELGVPIRTCSRLGSSPFYGFSSEHTEVQFTWRPSGWNTLESAKFFQQKFGKRHVVTPVNDRLIFVDDIQQISIEGHFWNVKDIHTRIDTTNYKALSLKSSSLLPFESNLPIAVINNKNYFQWNQPLRNSFDSHELEKLKNFLISKGYFVVYNLFREPVPEDYFQIDDVAVFQDASCYDMRTFYDTEESLSVRNEIQMAVYQKASIVIAPQGGTVYMPAIQRVPTFILMRKGEYIDYVELARIYDTVIECFYEVDHMIAYIERT